MSERLARMKMVDNQIRPADVTSYALLSAFLSTPRENFISQENNAFAYAEHEIDLGQNRKMMTPRTFAKLVQAVLPATKDKILLIGAGSGYEAAILSQLSTETVVIEENKSLYETAKANLDKFGSKNVKLINAEFAKGAAKNGPFDVIIMNGAIDSIPESLCKQMAQNGRLIAILEDNHVYSATLVKASHGDFARSLVFHASAPKLANFATKNEFEFV